MAWFPGLEPQSASTHRERLACDFTFLDPVATLVLTRITGRARKRRKSVHPTAAYAGLISAASMAASIVSRKPGGGSFVNSATLNRQ